MYQAMGLFRTDLNMAKETEKETKTPTVNEDTNSFGNMSRRLFFLRATRLAAMKPDVRRTFLPTDLVNSRRLTGPGTLVTKDMVPETRSNVSIGAVR